MQSTIKRAAGLVIAFLLALGICGTVGIIILQSTALNRAYMHDIIAACNYSGSVKQELLEQYEDYGFASNVPRDFFEDFLDITRIHDDVDKYIESVFSGSTPAKSGDKLRDDMFAALGKYAEAQGYTLDVVMNRQIYELSSLCGEFYQKQIDFPLLETIVKYLNTAGKYAGLATAALPVLSALCALVLFFLLRKEKDWLRNITFALLASSAMIITVPEIILVHGSIRNLSITPPAFYLFAVRFIETILKTFVNTGIIMLAVSIALVVIDCVLHRKELKKRRRRRRRHSASGEAS